jgi:hypothetical protein
VDNGRRNIDGLDKQWSNFFVNEMIDVLVSDQGDPIGWIFDRWNLVYFWQFYLNYKNSQKSLGYFFPR